jgi:hypothetical protein
MAYKGFVGSGTIGHFQSTTALQNSYPADMCAGRMATVEVVAGSATHYYSNGISWQPNAMLATDSTGKTVGIVDGNGNSIAPIILSQSAVPVMVAQSGFIVAIGTVGYLVAGPNTASTVGLSATSGSGVTVTFGSAILSGTAADIGKQVSIYDNVGGAWRSILITGNTSTTTCTATLASTFSSTSISSTNCHVGNPLPTNYTGGIWVCLPAGAVSGGAAGFYWCVAASTATANSILQVTTAFQSTMGVPAIPTGFSNATGSGANFTGVTTAIPVFQPVLSGSAMGANGAFTVAERHVLTNNSNAKTVRLSYGGTTIGINDNEASKAGGGFVATVRNMSTNLQTAPASGGDYSSAAPVFASINSAADQTIAISLQNSTATDYSILCGATLTLLPRA